MKLPKLFIILLFSFLSFLSLIFLIYISRKIKEDFDNNNDDEDYVENIELLDGVLSKTGPSQQIYGKINYNKL